MFKQNWNIDKKEKERILFLHENATKNLYLLKEQFKKDIVIDFGDTFESGRFQLTPRLESQVSQKVQELVSAIKGKNLDKVNIVIQPGESKVTNQPPFTQVGSLAEARANSLKDYLDKVLPKLLSFSPSITVAKPIIGSTPYKPGNNKDDPKYKAEQFVRAIVDTSASTDIKRKTSVGEPIYLNNRVIALIEKPFVDSSSIKDNGGLNVGKQNVTFKIVKPDTQPPIILDEYQIPWQWWNEKIGPSSTISQENYDYIINNFTKI